MLLCLHGSYRTRSAVQEWTLGLHVLLRRVPMYPAPCASPSGQRSTLPSEVDHGIPAQPHKAVPPEPPTRRRHVPLHSCAAPYQSCSILTSLATLRHVPAESRRSQRAVGSLRVPCRNAEASVEAVKELLQHGVGRASSMVVAPASLSSVTNLSWNVPAVRSTQACGDRAKTLYAELVHTKWHVQDGR